MSSLRLTNFKDKINISKNKFKNKVKINLDEDHEGKIVLEVSYMVDNNILIKTLKIYKINLIKLLEKFKLNNFLILQHNGLTEDNVSNINNIVNNKFHPEYRNNNVNFIKNSYNNSFNQKFK